MMLRKEIKEMGHSKGKEGQKEGKAQGTSNAASHWEGGGGSAGSAGGGASQLVMRMAAWPGALPAEVALPYPRAFLPCS